MTLGEHLEELRIRLKRSMGYLGVGVMASMFGYRRLVDLATLPHYRAMAWLDCPPPLDKFIALSHTASVGAVVKLTFIVSLFFSSPFIARELWRFVSAGLYPHERRQVRAFALCSFLLFLLGCLFGYFIMIPYTLYAMVTVLPVDKVAPVFGFGEYLQLVLALTILLGAIFQLPLAMVLLTRLGIAGSAQFRSWRRHAILASAVTAAIIAPPDVLSMAVFNLPLVVLYELGILASAIAARPS